MREPQLRLVLKKQWFDMIKSGEKNCEYREIKPYWSRVFTLSGNIRIKGKLYHPSDVTLCFYHGYRNDRESMHFQCAGAYVGTGKPEWGAIPGKNYFVIMIGEPL